jgi:hypothetical protein
VHGISEHMAQFSSAKLEMSLLASIKKTQPKNSSGHYKDGDTSSAVEVNHSPLKVWLPTAVLSPDQKSSTEIIDLTCNSD